MFNTLKNYALVILLVAAVGFGYQSYSLHGKNEVLRAQQDELVSVIDKANKDLKLANDQLKTTLHVLDTFDDTQNTLQNGLQRDLAAICKPTNPTPQGVANEPLKTPLKTHSSVPRDGRLDDDLVRVLDNAYCQGAGNDSSCRAEAANKATSGNTGN